ncbi:MAG: class I SAM-dependent methyltransferase [Bacillales bacterium]|nr:class I SAM-dependent methyltransferase [Mollicutes bacterium]MCI7213800.1 class I SAM-dependent methyltransferase [Bacillales bacterium]MDY3903703.1 class I SAM-dependent methyltransferase [Candidatus Enteromonas sp.]MCI7057720.1 class I SAM-dependent methyltransferase [Mollicutes bacterium]MDD7714331.1 class I SAM-dependent methyltransferase [Mollicutes bacterium]
MPQYFDNNEELSHDFHQYSFSLLGEEFSFISDSGVFCKDGLDDGSRLLLETIAKTDLGNSILDMGCGIGPIGLLLAHFDKNRHVTLVDVNRRALDCAKQNAAKLGLSSRVDIFESDVYSNINSSFSTIVTNPPIRAGKKVTYAMYAGAISHLNEGGQLILVIRKQQGASSCQEYLKTIFKEVEVVKSKKGYRILIAKK